MNILEWIYPPRCPLCGELVAMNREKVHKVCYKNLIRVREPLCKHCGKPLMSDEEKIVEFCQDCRRRRQNLDKGFDQGRAVWVYEGQIQKSLMDYKYKGMKSYTDFYGQEAVRAWGSWIRKKNPQVLVPVPIHSRKKRIRGFNQAELLARAIGKFMDIPVDELLCRKRWTEPQKAVSGRERRHNLTKSIEAVDKAGDYERVMLIDDIYTTGSTMEVCAEILKKKGVKEVYFLTICIGYGNG